MSNQRKKGVCCAGALCNHSEMELVPGEHHCFSCGGVYHVLCAKFIPQPLNNDPYNGLFLCLKCDSIPGQKNTVCPVVPSPANTNPPCDVPKPIICKACGKEGHYNSNTKKCSLFKGRRKMQKNKSNSITDSINKTTTDTAHIESMTLPSSSSSSGTSSIVLNPQTNHPPTNTTSSETTNTAPNEININTTNFIEVKTETQAPPYQPVIDVASPSFTPSPTIFKVYERDYRHKIYL